MAVFPWQESKQEKKPKTHREADDRAAELGLQFPAEVKTLKEKIAYLERKEKET